MKCNDMKRWKQYFEGAYNDTNPVDTSIRQQLPIGGDDKQQILGIMIEEAKRTLYRMKEN